MESALSTILKEIRINDSFYVKSELYGEWGFEDPAKSKTVFHYVVEGEFLLRTLDNKIYKFTKGDLVLTVHGQGHYIQSDENVKIKKIEDVKTTFLEASLAKGKKTVIICGGMNLEPSWHPFFKALPSFIYSKREEQICTKWLDNLIELMNIEVELNQAGNEAIITRLCEVLVIETIRKWLSKKDESLGLNLALQDKNIGNALVKMHKEPNINWTIEQLAKESNMSRTSFYEHFSMKIGSSPIQYLTFLRMNMAADDLKKGIKTISQIAEDIGYDSAISFNRAFKKFWGNPPGKFKLIKNI